MGKSPRRRVTKRLPPLNSTEEITEFLGRGIGQKTIIDRCPYHDSAHRIRSGNENYIGVEDGASFSLLISPFPGCCAYALIHDIRVGNLLLTRKSINLILHAAEEFIKIDSAGPIGLIVTTRGRSWEGDWRLVNKVLKKRCWKLKSAAKNPTTDSIVLMWMKKLHSW